MSNLWKPNKQRLISTLRGEIPDRVPNFEVLMEERNVDAILNRTVGSTMAASRGASDADVFLAPPMKATDYIEVVNYTGQDSLVLESLWAPFKIEGEDGKLHSIEHGYVKKWEDLDKIILPDWEKDILPRKEYLEEYIAAVKGTDIGVTYMTGTFFQYCYQFLVGFEDFCAMVYEDRELLEKILDVAMDFYIKITEVAINAGVDVMFFADDVAYHSGTFMHPTIFKELWFPRMKKLIDMAKEAGLPVMFHSCGNLNKIMDSVITELDIDCLYPVEPYCMNIYDIKPRYEEKFCIAGNLDIAGPFALGTPQEAYEAAKELIVRLKPNGKYIFASSHSITDDISPQNYNAVLNALHDFGVY